MSEYESTITENGSEEAKMYLKIISSYWPLVMIRALILLAVGVCFIAFPETTLTSFAILFGIFCIVESLVWLLKLCLLCKGGAGRTNLAFMYALTFLFNFIIGMVSVAWPDVTTTALLIMIAVWFILVGLVETGLACLLREKTWILLSGGMLCIMFGFILLVDLDRGATGMAVFIGVVLLLFAAQIACFACQLGTIYKQIAQEDSANPTGVVEGGDSAVV